VAAASKAEASVVKIVFRIFISLVRALVTRPWTSRFLRAFALEIAMAIANYYAAADHEAASQFVGQSRYAVKYSAVGLTGGLPLEANNGGGLLLADPVQWAGRRAS
jgi:hypothetical protein